MHISFCLCWEFFQIAVALNLNHSEANTQPQCIVFLSQSYSFTPRANQRAHPYYLTSVLVHGKQFVIYQPSTVVST